MTRSLVRVCTPRDLSSDEENRHSDDGVAGIYVGRSWKKYNIYTFYHIYKSFVIKFNILICSTLSLNVSFFCFIFVLFSQRVILHRSGEQVKPRLTPHDGRSGAVRGGIRTHDLLIMSHSPYWFGHRRRPGEHVELTVSEALCDRNLALEPRSDNKCNSPWIEPPHCMLLVTRPEPKIAQGNLNG